MPWSARSSHFIVFTFRSSLPSFQKISTPKENNKHVLKIGNTMQYYGVSSGDMFVIRVCHCFFSVVLKFPEESLEKFLCWMFFFALVSQVLSFYSLHISFFSPVISRDQYPQREQQTFPQDWEYYAILWSILWRYVCHTCLSLFFSVVLKFPEESLEKFLCWMFFFALVSEVLSFYSLHISFFSPVISRDQCPQREQQTFPQDWEYDAILWSILWRYVCHTCHCFFQLF